MDNKQKAALFMERFHGRQEVYGRAKFIKRDDGTTFKQYYPVCEKIWTPECHLTKKDGILCANCEIQSHKCVSAESVLLHIKGEEQHIYYLLQDDGTIRFSAFDFDNKPNKPQHAYHWEDVKKMSSLLKEWNMPHAIARSSGNGFHLYIFFKDPIKASKVRAVLYEAAEVVGFMEEHRNGARPLMEIFPKQEYQAVKGIGNGISPPMIEPRFEYERNCWVDDENKMIPANLQWEYFAKIESCAEEAFDKVIQERGLEVNDTAAVSARASGGSSGNRTINGKWRPPLSGSFEKMLEGCAALRKFKHKCLEGEEPGHDVGFSVYHLAMHTMDGLEWFSRHVPGWDKTEKDRRQLDASLGKNYSPYTCRKMQEKGLCTVGTKCLDKKPPIITIDGETKVDTSVPEAQWPDPSPIRYAFGKGDDFLKKLFEEVAEATKIEDVQLKKETAASLVQRAQVFDVKQRTMFYDYLTEQKLVTKTVLKSLSTEFEKEQEKKYRKAAEAHDDRVSVEETIYVKRDPTGYTKTIMSRGKQIEQVICECDIWIREERTYWEGKKPIGKKFLVETVYHGRTWETEIPTEDWFDNRRLYLTLGSLMGSSFNALLENMGAIKQAVQKFSEKAGIKKENYNNSSGWIGHAYSMPSVLVDKDGVRENTSHKVDLSFKQHAENLNFQILPDDELKEILMHIKTDLLTAFPKDQAIIGLSHTLMAGIMPILKIDKRPTLFYEGTPNSGKSALQLLLQNFYGHFNNILRLSDSTQKGIQDYGYHFKDAMLVFDDFKDGINHYTKISVLSAIQNSYDGFGRAVLDRSGNARDIKPNRALLVMSGEDFITSQASVVGRTILIEAPKRNLLLTKKNYSACQKKKDKYCGVTPRFISWMLNQDKEALELEKISIIEDLQEEVQGATNADRICQNLGWNLLTWKCFLGFMVSVGVIDSTEAAELFEYHKGVCASLRNTMIARCAEEQSGNVFFTILKELVLSRSVAIEGLPGYNPEHKPIVGFVKPEKPKIVFFHPTITHSIVNSTGKIQGLTGGSKSIARQMREEGIFIVSPDGKVDNQEYYDGAPRRVWPIDAEKLGVLKKAGPSLTTVATADDAGIF